MNYIHQNFSTCAQNIALLKRQKSYSNLLNGICDTIMENAAKPNELARSIRDRYKYLLTTMKLSLMDLVLDYISVSIQHCQISGADKIFVQVLKQAFEIKEGEFYKFRYANLSEMLLIQMQEIYRDNHVDMAEAAFKADLQDIFGLSYDQFLEFVNPEAIKAVKLGAKPANLDTFIEHRHWKDLDSQTELS